MQTQFSDLASHSVGGFEMTLLRCPCIDTMIPSLSFSS